MVAIGCALIAALGSIAGIWLTLRQEKRLTETHRQVTVNHHTSGDPTILDRLDDLSQQQQSLGRKIDRHIEWHLDRKN